MNEQKKPVIFEEPKKPEIENLIEIEPDTSNFSEPEKAKALIKNLRLNAGDKIKEVASGEYYEINPRMKLRGDSPAHYKKEIELIKKILTLKEIKSISNYMKRKKENDKISDKIYYGITRRVEKLYKWDDVKKIHIAKKKKDKEVCSYLDEISNMSTFSGFDNCIYHLLSKGKEDYLKCYKCAWNNKPIPNIQEWNEINDGEYRVLTDSEAERACEDYFDDDYLWKSAVEAGQTTSGKEEWIQEVKDYDGRGSILSGYDGQENEETINEINYYIYRTN